jgi:hypothetical protein
MIEPSDYSLKIMKVFGQLKNPFDELETLIDEPNENLKARTVKSIFPI